MRFREFFDYQLRTQDIATAKASLPPIKCPKCGGDCVPYWDNFPFVVTTDYLVSGLGADWTLTYICAGDCGQEYFVEDLEVDPDSGGFIQEVDHEP